MEKLHDEEVPPITTRAAKRKAQRKARQQKTVLETINAAQTAARQDYRRGMRSRGPQRPHEASARRRSRCHASARSRRLAAARAPTPTYSRRRRRSRAFSRQAVRAHRRRFDPIRDKNVKWAHWARAQMNGPNGPGPRAQMNGPNKAQMNG